jgi:hypothetical protein
MNRFGIRYDFPGLCSLCHDEIAEFGAKLPNGRYTILRWKHTKEEITLQLDNGSKMRVAVCSTCFNKFKPEDCEQLMTSVIEGWSMEVRDCCPDWTADRRRLHMEEYSKREVTGRHDVIWTDDDCCRIKNIKKEK